MKKLITLLFFTFTVSLFGQMKEYKKATNLYNDKKFSEANIILEKLINKEYGELEQEMAFYVLYMNAGCYYNLNDFKIAYKKYEELIVFVKNSVNLFSSQTGKEEQIASLEKFKEDFKSKIPKDENTSIQNNISSESNTTTKSVSNENITKANSDNKTVTLTVSGTGKTLEEARLNALRSAIEQAFGAFISSKTEILNDNLVKDEIVSVSSGNIENYNIISQTEIPNNGYAMTLSATVSIDKLTSFAQSKGVVVEFKGGMFGLKIKLQKLNEDSEIIAIKNLTSACFDILNSGLDFELQVSEPVRVNATEDEFDVVFSIMTKANSNVDVFNNYFNETIKKISLTDSEILEYKKLNNPLYTIKINNSEYKLRSELSILYIYNFLKSTQFFVNTFKIFSNLETIKFSYSDIYTFNESTIIYAKEYSPYSSGPIKKDETKQFFLNAFYVDNYDYASYMSTDERYWIYLAPEFVELTKKHDLTKDVMLYDKTYLFKFKRQNTGLIYKTTFNHTTLKFKKRFKLSEINKINEFKLDKIDINEFLKNRNLYMITEKKSESPKEINSKSSLVPAK